MKLRQETIKIVFILFLLTRLSSKSIKINSNQEMSLNIETKELIISSTPKLEDLKKYWNEEEKNYHVSLSTKMEIKIYTDKVQLKGSIEYILKTRLDREPTSMEQIHNFRDMYNALYKHTEMYNEALEQEVIKLYICFYMDFKNKLELNEICFTYKEISYTFNYEDIFGTKTSSTRTFKEEDAIIHNNCFESTTFHLNKPVLDSHQKYNRAQYGWTTMIGYDPETMKEIFIKLNIKSTNEGGACLTPDPITVPINADNQIVINKETDELILETEAGLKNSEQSFLTKNDDGYHFRLNRNPNIVIKVYPDEVQLKISSEVDVKLKYDYRINTKDRDLSDKDLNIFRGLLAGAREINKKLERKAIKVYLCAYFLTGVGREDDEICFTHAREILYKLYYKVDKGKHANDERKVEGDKAIIETHDKGEAINIIVKKENSPQSKDISNQNNVENGGALLAKKNYLIIAQVWENFYVKEVGEKCFAQKSEVKKRKRKARLHK
jgi:hypothetical protein